MHLRLHLKDCLLDYGPVQSFRCFSFERLNGVMGKYHTNNEMIEIQIMKKFLSEQKIKSLSFPSEGTSIFNFQKNLSGSSKGSSLNDVFELISYAKRDNLHSDYSIPLI